MTPAQFRKLAVDIATVPEGLLHELVADAYRAALPVAKKTAPKKKTRSRSEASLGARGAWR